MSMPINGGGPGRHRVGWKRPRLRWQQHQQVVMMMLVVWMLLCPDDTTKHHVSAVRIKTPRRRVTNVDGEDRPNVNTLKSWASSSFGQYPVLDEYLDEKGSFLDEYTELFNTKLAAAYDAMVDEIQPLRDAWDGLRSAYHLAWTGYYHGFVGLVYEYPWEGFSRDGILGLVTGTAAGVVHFSTMTTSGIAAGLYQAVRGLERTVTAIQATRDGMVWHNIRKEWFYYSLDKEAENVGHDNAEQIPGEGSTKRQLRRRVKDYRFYELLDVTVDASAADIKKAYYRQALAVHPDKSSESEAEEQFRHLNLAYKTLVTKESRELYDTHGVCFADHLLSENSARVDPYSFFSILFGTGVVEPYVGDLAIASIVDNTLLLTERAETVSIGDSNYASPQQIRRQIEIASHLRDRIQNFTNGDMTIDEFQSSCRVETQSLAFAMEETLQAEFLLKAISSGIISATADYTMPSWAKSMMAGVSNTLFDAARNIKVVYDLEKAIRKAVKKADDSTNVTATSSSESDDDCNSGNSDIDGLLLHLAVPKTLKLVWNFNANDISRTLREACTRVIDDSAGDNYLRVKRAKALNILGHEFYAAIRSRQDLYGKGEGRGAFPNEEEIQENVKMALMEAIVSESFE